MEANARKSMQRESALRWFSAALLFSVVALSAGQGSFSYDESRLDGPQYWGYLQPEWATCRDGQAQSPIPVHVENGIIDPLLTELNTTYLPARAVLVRDPHVVQVKLIDGDLGHFWLHGDKYVLQQFHFHSPSEHVINDVRFPLEMHLVHKTADDEKIAVIGIPFKYGPASPFLDQFWEKLSLLRENLEVDIGTLILDTPDLTIGPTFARYKGSLTTPPCTEGVTWTLTLDKGNTISLDQLRDLKSIYPEATARPLQKLHGRDVGIFDPESSGTFKSY